MAIVAPVPLSFLLVCDGESTLFVQKTELTNHQFDRLWTQGADTPFGLAGPSKDVSLALLARGNDPEAFLRKMEISAAAKKQLQLDLRELTPSRPLVVGGYSVFKVTDQPSKAGFDGSNQPRVDLSFYDALWAYDVMAPGKGRLLTHREWDLVSGVTEGILCATASGKPTKDQTNLMNEVGRTTDVGSYPSFRGFDDLIGNVWEWVLPDQADQNPGLRGWSWYSGPGDVRVSACRYDYGADDRLNVIGARGMFVP